MKTKKLNKKLVLNKKTISTLDYKNGLGIVYGGATLATGCITDCTVCIGPSCYCTGVCAETNDCTAATCIWPHCKM
jgi:hypothetical protein